MNLKNEIVSATFWLQAGWYAIGWYIAIAIVWFFVFFTPVVVIDSSVKFKDGKFTLDNWAYKTNLSSTLCDVPPAAIVVFETTDQSITAKVPDNARGTGAGNEKARLWSSTGEVPDTMPVGENIVVYKKLSYPCLGFNKVVYTPKLLFYNYQNNHTTTE